MNPQSSFALHTLGCKLNFSESSSLARQLKENGYTQKDFSEKADVYILNTCSVTDNADKECRQIIRKINHQYPESFIAVVGCYAQLKPNEISQIKGVDLVLGASEKFNLVDHLKQLTQKGNPQIHNCEIESVEDFKSAFSFQDRTRAFLKIQDGCNYTCSYCTIPLARGKSRSDDFEKILSSVNALYEKGVKEIVLTGVNLGDYKKNEKSFADIVTALSELPYDIRFRISSIEPNLLTNEIIAAVAKSKNFMPHFHIPLQSGSNKILGLMKRRYQRELYEEKILNIKNLMPHCGIGVDVITGFPNENESDFEDTYHFIEKLNISYLHVFTYSERSNTLAIDIPNAVPLNIRKQRNKRLRSLSLNKTETFYSLHKNTNRKVLFESKQNDNTIEGYTDNYIKIKTFYQADLENKIVAWDIV